MYFESPVGRRTFSAEVVTCVSLKEVGDDAATIGVVQLPAGVGFIDARISN
jgi:hypothetical protein